MSSLPHDVIELIRYLAGGLLLPIVLSVIGDVITQGFREGSPLVRFLNFLRRHRSALKGMAVLAVALLAFSALAPIALRVANGNDPGLSADDDALLERVSGVRECTHVAPEDDALAEVSCIGPDSIVVSLYFFRSTTAESAWITKMAQGLEEGTCVDEGMSEWAIEGSDTAGQLACYQSDGSSYLLSTTYRSRVGVQLKRRGDDIQPLQQLWQGVIRVHPSNEEASGPCARDDHVLWDFAGEGHDGWRGSSLSLREVAPCTTVMVSSGTLNTPDGDRCTGGMDSVCVLVWYTSEGRAMEANGLSPGATWWSYANAPIDLAIKDKADFYNRKGWFASGNCSTRTGCASAQVWIDNDGAISKQTVEHP